MKVMLLLFYTALAVSMDASHFENLIVQVDIWQAVYIHLTYIQAL